MKNIETYAIEEVDILKDTICEGVDLETLQDEVIEYLVSRGEETTYTLRIYAEYDNGDIERVGGEYEITPEYEECYSVTESTMNKTQQGIT